MRHSLMWAVVNSQCCVLKMELRRQKKFSCHWGHWPLANAGSTKAMHNLASSFYFEKDMKTAYKWFSAAFCGVNSVLDGHSISLKFASAFYAMECGMIVGRLSSLPSAKLWMAIGHHIPPDADVQEWRHRLEWIVRMQWTLRMFRKSCAFCSSALDCSNRKLCRGCRNHCYCSRECQKQHWDLVEGGHRAQCEEAQALKVQIRDSGLMEKLAKKQ